MLKYKTKHGNTALHEASRNGHYQTVLCLITQECNANVNAQNNFRGTALYYTSINNHLEIVQYLTSTFMLMLKYKIIWVRPHYMRQVDVVIWVL